MWEALADIGRRENASLNQLCTHVATTRPDGGFTSNLRVFIMNYFRALQTANANANGMTTNAANVDSATPPATSSGAVLNLSANR
jgi:predicted DNA-binding ribbon-helix-helix protein